MMNIICRGTSTINSNASWQIPFSCYFIVPTIVGILIWFVPESPRWLLSQVSWSRAQALSPPGPE